MKNKLWCDLKTDSEKVEFLRSGRAFETGIIAKSIVEEVAQAFERPPNNKLKICVCRVSDTVNYGKFDQCLDCGLPKQQSQDLT